MLPAALGQERDEVNPSVVAEDDRLAVDHHFIRVEAANRVGDPGSTIREVGAAPL
jgi:hypothetical protein